MGNDRNTTLMPNDKALTLERVVPFISIDFSIRDKVFRARMQRIAEEGLSTDKAFIRWAFFCFFFTVATLLVGLALLEPPRTAALLTVSALLVIWIVFRLGRSHAQTVQWIQKWRAKRPQEKDGSALRPSEAFPVHPADPPLATRPVGLISPVDGR